LADSQGIFPALTWSEFARLAAVFSVGWQASTKSAHDARKESNYSPSEGGLA